MQTPFISSLSLKNYRNYSSLNLDFHKSCLIFGRNGIGKTNILEALSLFGLKQGIRGAPLENMIQNGERSAFASSSFIHPTLGRMHLEINIEPTTTKTFRKSYFLDGAPIKPQIAVDYFPSIISLIPQMDNFFIQDNSLKKRFIDKLIITLDKKHNSRLNEYESLIKERNKVLHFNEPKWLTYIEEQLASLSSAIVASRIEFINNLNNILKTNDIHPLTLKFNGVIEDLYQQYKFSTKVEENIKSLLLQNRDIDRLKNSTSIGCHKSKVTAFSYKKNSIAEICSTGEQKIMLINIILAFFKVVLELKKVKPALLLDEISVHLDSFTLEVLFKRLEALNTQIFITTTSCDNYSKLTQNLQLISLETIINIDE